METAEIATDYPLSPLAFESAPLTLILGLRPCHLFCPADINRVSKQTPYKALSYMRLTAGNSATTSL